jgi:DNA-binding HxlR family transcriptional regulator
VPKVYGQSCPVAKSLEFLGERWTLLIVRDLLAGPRKFQDLQKSLKGVAPAVLSERLKGLEKHAIISRVFYSEHPPRAEYVLTPRGRELRTIVGALAIWGSRHLRAERALVHDVCHTKLEMAYYCPACDKRVGGAGVQFKPATRQFGAAPSLAPRNRPAIRRSRSVRT